MTDDDENDRAEAMARVTVSVRLSAEEYRRLRAVAAKRGERHQRILHGWIERGLRDAERAR